MVVTEKEPGGRWRYGSAWVGGRFGFLRRGEAEKVVSSVLDSEGPGLAKEVCGVVAKLGQFLGRIKQLDETSKQTR